MSLQKRQESKAYQHLFLFSFLTEPSLGAIEIQIFVIFYAFSKVSFKDEEAK